MSRAVIEVAYARPEQQLIIELPDALDMTVQQAIEASGILQQFPEIDLAVNKVGIFGKTAPLDAVLAAGDRVEIYRPLVADPKEARRRRAKAAAAARVP
ncbi:MAG: RnfH family protein [Candidatus Polarisedimenticolaceae bacterium]|nr:RnfH family protein [Candidatus Polarisedimenticolaceae bacterium]